MERNPPIAHRILLAAVALAGARAVLMVLKDEHFAAGLAWLGARSGWLLAVFPLAVFWLRHWPQSHLRQISSAIGNGFLCSWR